MLEEIREAAPENVFFQGRSDDPRLGEWVRVPSKLEEISAYPHPVVLIGFPDDTGIHLNRGRVGASRGPDEIRRSLYRMAPPCDFDWTGKITLVDLGNIRITNSILETHARLSHLLRVLGEASVDVIVLGGGHDLTAPAFLGYRAGYASESRSAWGLINIDPHLDVRPDEDGKPHSGTSFRRILESQQISPKNFVEFGYLAHRNARLHYDYVRGQGVELQALPAILNEGAEKCFQKTLTRLKKRTDHIAVSFDADACREIEGVSAPTLLGFTALQLVSFAVACGASREVQYLDIAEISPPLEQSGRAARLGAEIVFAFLRGRASIAPPRRKKNKNV